VNFVGNYYRPGGASTIFFALNAQYDNFPGTQQYYFTKNVMPGHFDENSQTSGRQVSAGTPQGYEPWVQSAFFPSYATIQSAGDSFKNVLSDVGCTQPVFDDHDVRVVKETLNGTTTYKGSVSGKPGLPDNEADVGGYESYPTTTREATWDSDGDGLPDGWEVGEGIKPNDNRGRNGANGDANGDGEDNYDKFERLNDDFVPPKPHHGHP